MMCSPCESDSFVKTWIYEAQLIMQMLLKNSILCDDL